MSRGEKRTNGKRAFEVGRETGCVCSREAVVKQSGSYAHALVSGVDDEVSLRRKPRKR